MGTTTAEMDESSRIKGQSIVIRVSSRLVFITNNFSHFPIKRFLGCNHEQWLPRAVVMASIASASY